MLCFLRRFVSDQTGSPATEYAVLASLIGIAIIGSLEILGVSVSGLYAAVSGAL